MGLETLSRKWWFMNLGCTKKLLFGIRWKQYVPKDSCSHKTGVTRRSKVWFDVGMHWLFCFILECCSGLMTSYRILPYLAISCHVSSCFSVPYRIYPDLKMHHDESKITQVFCSSRIWICHRNSTPVKLMILHNLFDFCCLKSSSFLHLSECPVTSRESR